MALSLTNALTEVRSLIDEPNAVLARMEARSVRDPKTGCRIWTGPVNNVGYPQIQVNKRRWYLHRLSYLIHNGSIVRKMDVGHQCHDQDPECSGGTTCIHRRCWEPTHLVQQSRQENLLAGKTLVAAKARQTHCIHGHEFTPENTMLRTRPSGGRVCLTCAADRMREKRRREQCL